MAQEFPVRVLLAEDVMVNQKVAIAMLQQLGYRAEVANTGQEVLEALARQPYDVVLMDVLMPDMDGLEATRRIRERYKSQYSPWIIAMTAHATGGDRQDCLKAGMNDYVNKPMRLDALKQALQKFQDWKSAGTVEAAASEANSPLDTHAFQELEAMMGEEAESLILDIITTYLQDAPHLLGMIQQAAEQHDANALYQSAHTFKAPSATVGATGLVKVCQALEAIARSENVAAALPLVAQLHAEYQRVEAALVQKSQTSSSQNASPSGH